MAKIFLSPSNQANNIYAYGGANESEQCLKIATACEEALKRCGFETMLMHKESMAERCKKADAWGANLYVPIHTNAYNGKVGGTRLFYYSKNGEEYKACKAVFDVLAPFTPGTSENYRQNTSLYEVRVPKAPTVYIEVDFHDVPEIAKWIIANTKQIGEKICEGICNHYGVKYVVDSTAELEAEIENLTKENENLKKENEALKAKISAAVKMLNT